MGMDNARKLEVLTWMHAGAQPAAITSLIHLRPVTVIGTDAAPGTEVASGGGYTSGSGAPTIATWAAASGTSQATSAAVSITNYPRVENVVGVDLYDSNGTPKRVEWGSHTSKAMAAGDTLTYASGAITSAIA